MNGTKLESEQCVKNLGVTIASSLKFSQQCKDTVVKANRILGFINRKFSFRSKDAVLPLYISLIKPPSGICRGICKGYSKTGSCPAKEYENYFVLAKFLSRQTTATRKKNNKSLKYEARRK